MKHSLTREVWRYENENFPSAIYETSCYYTVVHALAFKLELGFCFVKKRTIILKFCCCVVAEQTPESASSGSSWTGWAVTSLTSKLYRGGNTPPDATEPDKNTTTNKERNTGKAAIFTCILYTTTCKKVFI